MGTRNGSVAGAVSLTKDNSISMFVTDGLSDDEKTAINHTINHILCETVAETVLLRFRDKGAPHQFNLGNDDALTHIYYLKKYTLIAQNYFNDKYFNMAFELVDPLNDKSERGICKWCARRINAIQKIVPERVIDDCYDADYEVYTDRFYHRKFWNEIPNDRATTLAFDAFRTTIMDKYQTKKSDDYYTVSFYDFNDADIQFDSKKLAESFIETHDCAPFTLFKVSGTRIEEIYSV